MSGRRRSLPAPATARCCRSRSKGATRRPPGPGTPCGSRGSARRSGASTRRCATRPRQATGSSRPTSGRPPASGTDCCESPSAARIPYGGAGVLASAVGMDKAVQKTRFEAAGLTVVPHQVVHERDWERHRTGVLERAADLGLPVFTKPASLGSSIGITKVKRAADLAAALEDALAHSGKALIERSMEGARELECAVLGNDEPVASV